MHKNVDIDYKCSNPCSHLTHVQVTPSVQALCDDGETLAACASGQMVSAVDTHCETQTAGGYKDRSNRERGELRLM